MVTFVNQFDMSVRSKLSSFHGKLTKLERAIDLCESTLNASTIAIQGNKEAELGVVEGDSRDESD